MTPIDFIKKIKNYAIASFLIPLIAINSCLLIYKFLGDKALWPNFPYDKEKFEYTFIEHQTKLKNFETWTFTNCPKYLHKERFITLDNQTIENNFENKDIYLDLKENNKIKNIISEQGKNLNDKCVKNYQLTYLLLKKFSSLETILINAVQKNPVGFVKIKNPYFYG